MSDPQESTVRILDPIETLHARIDALEAKVLELGNGITGLLALLHPIVQALQAVVPMATPEEPRPPIHYRDGRGVACGANDGGYATALLEITCPDCWKALSELFKKEPA